MLSNREGGACTCSLEELLEAVGRGQPLWEHLGSSWQCNGPANQSSQGCIRGASRGLRGLSEGLITHVARLVLGWNWEDCCGGAGVDTQPEWVQFCTMSGRHVEDAGSAGSWAGPGPGPGGCLCAHPEVGRALRKSDKQSNRSSTSAMAGWHPCQVDQQERVERFLRRLTQLRSMKVLLGQGGEVQLIHLLRPGCLPTGLQELELELSNVPV